MYELIVRIWNNRDMCNLTEQATQLGFDYTVKDDDDSNKAYPYSCIINCNDNWNYAITVMCALVHTTPSLLVAIRAK